MDEIIEEMISKIEKVRLAMIDMLPSKRELDFFKDREGGLEGGIEEEIVVEIVVEIDIGKDKVEWC